MEWNSLLLWIAGVSSAIALVRMAMSPARQWGFLATSVAVLVAIGIAWLIEPEIAGIVGGIVWGAFVLVPALMYRKVARAVAAMDYDLAAAWASAARWLHPMDGWWNLPRLFRATAMADRGEDAQAESMLEPLRSRRPPIGLAAELQYRRLKHDWAGVIDVAQTAARERGVMRTGSAVPMYLRAMGELNQIEQMLKVYEQCRLTFKADAFGPMRATARWMVLAFTGQTAAMDEQLDHFFRKLSRDRRRFWRARAEWAAGRIDAAAAEFSQLLHSHETGTALAAAYVLAHPPAAAEISSEGRAVLAQAEQDARHDKQYAIAPHGYANWALVTYGLIVVNVIYFGFEVYFGGSEDPATLIRLGAAETLGLSPGEWWRSITANFMHFGIAHLALNMLALKALGPFVEQFVGRVRFAIIYAASGIGAVASVVWLMNHHLLEKGWLVGASGAIMGLIGATSAILLHGWLREGAGVARQRLGLIVFIVALQVVFDAMTPEVSGSAHLIGLAFGFVVTLSMVVGKKKMTNAQVSMTNQ